MKYDRSCIASVHDYNINIDTREIYLHEYYSSESNSGDPGIDYRMASMFVKNLNLLNQIGDQEIIIHQHTTGGNWNDGIAIYDALRSSLSQTVMLVYAEASSMSSVTIQGADVRYLYPNVEVMIHYGFIGSEGIPSQVHSAMEQSKRIDEIMLKIYSQRCIRGKYFKERKMDEKDVVKYIKNKIQTKTDWYMTAEEAVFYGFADGVVNKINFGCLVNGKQKSKKT